LRYHRIRTGEVEAEASDAGGEEDALDARVLVEALRNVHPLVAGNSAVDARVGDRGEAVLCNEGKWKTHRYLEDELLGEL